MTASSLASKLNLKPGMKLRVVGKSSDEVWSAMRFRPKK